jgi:glycosyltransferase involved in cell wall biosynthesis
MVVAARLATQEENWTFTIVGGGPLLDELRAAEQDLPNLDVVGPVDSDTEVLDILSSARVFALPSSREGFGLAALEAMAAGVPVVTIDHPHNATGELITPSVSGFIADPNPRRFAEALFEVLRNDTLHQRMYQGALAVAERHSWPSLIGDFVDLYMSCQRPAQPTHAAPTPSMDGP